VEDGFVAAEGDVEPDEHMDIGAQGRPSETFVPVVWVESDADAFFGGLMWSGAWHAGIGRTDDRLQVRFDFPGVTTTVTPARPLELPHAFFGMTTPADVDRSTALQQFIQQGIRRGRPLTPLVTYNTWVVYGTTLNAAAI